MVVAVLALMTVGGLDADGPAVSAEHSAESAAAPTAPGQGTWPAGLREATRAAVAADAYRFAPGADGAWAATTPAQGLRSRFGPTGPTVDPLAGGWSLDLSLARLGRPGALVQVAPAQVVGSVDAVEYRRGPSLVEWYRNEGRGLEQGFTLATAPPNGPGPLILELHASGLVLALSPDGSEVVGSTAEAEAVLRYGGLEVVDATGRHLPASLAVDGQAVQLRIDDAGARYPLTVDPWFHQAKLTASDAASDDQFGYSVAVSGDTAVVGANTDDTPAGADAGSAYVFVRSGATWAQQAKLTASDAATNDLFGKSVAVSGDTAVVGAEADNTPAGSDAGSAYVFVRSGATWTQQAKLTASDAAADDILGRTVAVSGDTAVVGTPGDDTPAGTDTGSAYVFVRSGGAWTQQQKLTASDAAANDQFGASVGLSGDTALVGARLDDTPAATNAGSAYVFVRSGAAWTQQQQLTASDAAKNDQLGGSVAASGDTAVVGANADDTPAGEDAGSAYVFVRSGGAWTQQQKLTASDAAAYDQFGISIAASGDTAVVGANADDTPAGVNAGSAYVFVRSGATWIQQQRITASDAAGGDRLGVSVAVSGATIVVGADVDTTPASARTGSAYVFALDSAPATCSYTIVAGPPRHIDFTVQDVGAGIATIAVTTAVNIVTPVPIEFVARTTGPVNFTATKANQSLGSKIAIVITDVAGNKSSCI